MKINIWIRLLLVGIFAAGLCLAPQQSVNAAVANNPGNLALPGIGGIMLPEWLVATAANGLESQPNAGQ